MGGSAYDTDESGLFLSIVDGLIKPILFGTIVMLLTVWLWSPQQIETANRWELGSLHLSTAEGLHPGSTYTIQAADWAVSSTEAGYQQLHVPDIGGRWDKALSAAKEKWERVAGRWLREHYFPRLFGFAPAWLVRMACVVAITVIGLALLPMAYFGGQAKARDRLRFGVLRKESTADIWLKSAHKVHTAMFLLPAFVLAPPTIVWAPLAILGIMYLLYRARSVFIEVF